MASPLIENVNTVIINTGNILSLNDLTKNPAQNPSEELVEAIKITVSNSDVIRCESEDTNLVTSKHNDVIEKIAEHEIQNLKIGIKVFLNSDSSQFLREALDKAFKALDVSAVHNVIISLNIKDLSHDELVTHISNIWSTLEEFVAAKKVTQIGLADVDENVFRAIYESSTAKPSIIQINLATCCVVPPTLQQFCKEHEVLLLTHSDPVDILPTSATTGIFGHPMTLNWAVRFLVHIQCRGVLTTKGYILSLSK